VFHITPFLILLSLVVWCGVSSEWKGDAATLAAGLTFGWFLLANFLINAIVDWRGSRIGPLDFSKNLNPTTTEKILMWLIAAIAFASGVIAVALIVDYIKRGGRGGLETTILFGGAGFIAVAGATLLLLTFVVIVLSGFRIRPVRG
jgi:hypothetical protein